MCKTHNFLLGIGALLSSLISGSVLKYDWTKGNLYTDLAKMLRDYESKCNDETYYHGLRNEGMGSDLHVWSQALCNSMQWGVSLNIANYTWIWNDAEMCGDSTFNSSLACYFTKPNPCPESQKPVFINWGNKFGNCQKYIQDDRSRALFRAAAMEYLFSRVSPRLYHAAENAAREIFNMSTGGSIPNDMIAVHIRWGDKAKEMKLVGLEEYINAIKLVIANHSISQPSIYLVTENADAVEMVKKEISSLNSSWKIYSHGHFLTDYERKQLGHRVPTGQIGKANLISLLIAMESKYYVLTTGSNWSRILNELRTNVVDQVCNKCTAMVDLQHEGTHSNW